MSTNRIRPCLLAVIALLATSLLLLGSCTNRSSMPFNGEITFHDVSLTIPGGYIRDSTQSSADQWIFEKGFYSQYVILVRKDLAGEAAGVLDSYAAYLTAQGVTSERTTFLDAPAVRSRQDQDGTLWQELLVAHGDSTYAIALRGGTEADFDEIIRSLKLQTKAE